jgi:hypothetical protein
VTQRFNRKPGITVGRDSPGLAVGRNFCHFMEFQLLPGQRPLRLGRQTKVRGGQVRGACFVIHWTDSKFRQTFAQFRGWVGGGLPLVAGVNCQINWHYFDNLGNDVVTEIGSGSWPVGEGAVNHWKTDQGPEYRNHDF